jgi:ketosteroid isomerase-like protein
MKRLTLVLLSALLLPRGATAQQQAVADSIRRQADRFIAALASKDIDQFVSLFTTSPDFIYVDAGNIYPDPPALRKAGAGFFSRIKTFNAKWDPEKIVVLGPDGGAFTGVLKVDATDTADKPIWPLGKIWTLVYQRRAGKWQIIQAHEANIPPPRKAG